LRRVQRRNRIVEGSAVVRLRADEASDRSGITSEPTLPSVFDVEGGQAASAAKRYYAASFFKHKLAVYGIPKKGGQVSLMTGSSTAQSIRWKHKMRLLVEMA
jgi:hypothetical protein